MSRQRATRTLLDIMTSDEYKPIKTKTDYRAALKEIELLMRAAPGSAQGERLDVLVTLVESYEKTHFPLELPDPVEAIKFQMEQKGLTAKDLTPMASLIGSTRC